MSGCCASTAPTRPTNEQATAHLRITVKDPDPRKVGRRFSNATMELALGGYAGLPHHDPADAGERVRRLLAGAGPAARRCEHAAVLPDGTRVPIARHHPGTGGSARRRRSRARYRSSTRDRRRPAAAATARRCAPPWAGCARPARATRAATPTSASGPATRPAYQWLRDYLTTERLRSLLPEAQGLEVRRFELPNLHALNFVIAGLLGEGVASSTRPDPQAKGLGEYLRSRLVTMPAALLEGGLPG